MSKAALLRCARMDTAAESPEPQDREPSDEALLQRLAAGDSHAIGMLFTRHAATAFRVARRCTNHSADAEDAVQAAFTQVLLRKPGAQFRGHSSVKGWLMGIVVNTCRMQARETVSRKAREAQSAEQMRASETVANPLADDALRAVERLPEEYRLPVWLHFVERLTFGEIALALDLSEEAAAKRASRGLERVRETLGAAGTVAAMPALLASVPLESAPATLLAGISKLAVTGAATAPAPAAVASHASASWTGQVFKIGAACLLAGVAATAAIAFALKEKPAETALPAPKEPEPAGGEKPSDSKRDLKAPLGSPAYYPSPERPVGWRGDGTGRYVGAAKPPLHWSRIAQTSLTGVRVRADKPASDADHEGEPLSFGAITAWALAGPFPDGGEAIGGLDKSYIEQEAEAAPKIGDQAGGKKWAEFRVGGSNTLGEDGEAGVELVKVFGQTPESVAYAHAWIWSPQAVNAQLGIATSLPFRCWLNGAVALEARARIPIGNTTAPVSLKQGWNRLLVKVPGAPKTLNAADLRKSWRFRARLSPTEKDFSYTSTNITWMAPMPDGTTSLPVIVGDRIFTTANYFDLICLDKNTGRPLWIRSNTPYEAKSDAERAGWKDAVEPLAQKLAEQNDAVLKAMSERVSPQGLSNDQLAAFAATSAERSKTELKMCEAMMKGGSGKPMRNPCIQHCGTSNGTPCSDGKRLWAMFGGGIYSGPMTLVCYDLDGKRLWARSFDDLAADEHGNHASPLLIGGTLVCGTNKLLMGFDPDTGASKWEVKVRSGGNSPVGANLGGTPVIVGVSNEIVRASDGKMLSGTNAAFNAFPFSSTIVQDGVAYVSAGWNKRELVALKLPAKADGEKAVAEVLFHAVNEEFSANPGYNNMLVATPLYHDRMIYYISEGGVLAAVSAEDGKVAYTRLVSEMRPRTQWVSYPGVCACPTLAGDRVYLTDDCGITVVMRPGAKYETLAVNRLENFERGSQEQTLSTPVFEGESMYLRTPRYLYCVREK